MLTTEHLEILIKARGMLSQMIQNNFNEQDEIWFKAMLRTAGELDTCIINIQKKLKEQTKC